MENFAPDRQDTKRGFSIEPNVLPVSCSINLKASISWSQISSEKTLLAARYALQACGYRKTRGYWNADTVHFGQVGTLAAQQVTHGGVAIGFFCTKEVHEFLGHFFSTLSSERLKMEKEMRTD